MLRTLSSLAFAAALASAAAACGTTSDAAPGQQPTSPQAGPPPVPTTPTTPQAAAHGDLQNRCTGVFARMRTCSDQYVPALVDVRVRLDRPPGIAAQAASDRAGVIAQATQEWRKDSTDQAIAATCQHMVAEPPAKEDLDRAGACLAQHDCSAFVSCMTPIFEAHMR